MIAAEALHAARASPLVSLASLSGNAPIVVLAPHPDDETLGCGGLIAACALAAIPVDVALLTDGAASHPDVPPRTLAPLRLGEMRAALRELGLTPDRLHPMGWPDAHAPTSGADFRTAAEQLTALIRRTGARTLLASWGSDPHADHEAAAAIAAAAAAATGARHLAYPVWGWMLPDLTPVQAGPAIRLDITAHLPAKRRALACHRSQHGAMGSPGFVLPARLLEACLTPAESFFDQTAA